MLKIHETATVAGDLTSVFLTRSGAGLAIVDGAGTFPLPDGALEAVMARYGAPLDDVARVVDVASLDLGAGRRVRHVRHLARFDVIAKDWLVYEHEGAEPACALARTVASALGHLSRAAARPLSGS